jgi:hypothetical protein
MSDLKLGQTRSEAFKLISGGAAYTLTFGWQPDLVIVNNLTDWTGTAGGKPRSFWFRGQITDAHAFQQAVTNTAAAESYNFLDTATNGFTLANTSGGVASYSSAVSTITQADPCVVTTTAAHGLSDGQQIRITDLGSDMPTARGMDELNNERYEIAYIDSTSFSLKDPISGEAIDSTSYTAYVEGGRVNLVREDDVPFTYDEITYKLTLGTSVVGGDGDVLLVEAHGWGLITDLGDVG